jgi:hypothetical protein
VVGVIDRGSVGKQGRARGSRASSGAKIAVGGWKVGAAKHVSSPGLECPIHGIVPREETVGGYEIAKKEYVRLEPDELKALEQASSSALVIDAFVPRGRSTRCTPKTRTISVPARMTGTGNRW